MAKLVGSYKRIASEFQILGRDYPKMTVLQLVRDWLEAKYKYSWLMIENNVENRNVFFETYSYAGKC